MEQIYRQNSNIVARKIGEETILVPAHRDARDLQRIYCLNEVGSFLWEQVNGERSFTDLVGSIHSEFAVSMRQAESDVRAFLTQLSKIGAIAVLARGPAVEGHERMKHYGQEGA